MCIRVILTQVVRDVIESYEALAIIFETGLFSPTQRRIPLMSGLTGLFAKVLTQILSILVLSAKESGRSGGEKPGNCAQLMPLKGRDDLVHDIMVFPCSALKQQWVSYNVYCSLTLLYN